MKRLIIAGFALCAAAAVAGARPKAPTVSATYDGFAPGGRAIAMGLAYTAVGEDGAAIYFNPAGMTKLAGNSVGITYEIGRQSDLEHDAIFASELLRNKNLLFISLASPNGSFAWRPLADYTQKTANGADWEENEVQASAYTFSVSHKHNDRFSSGLNLSYLSGRVAEAGVNNNVPRVNISDGYGFSADLGFLYEVSSELRLGLMLQNLAGFMWWNDYETDQLPFVVRAGLAFQVANVFTFASDWEKRYYRDGDPLNLSHVGVEQRLGLIALRMGLYGTDLNNQQKTHYTAGLGYQQNSYTLSLTGEKYRIDQKDVYRYVFSLDFPI